MTAYNGPFLDMQSDTTCICAGGSATTIGGDALFGAIIGHTSCVQCSNTGNGVACHSLRRVFMQREAKVVAIGSRYSAPQQRLRPGFVDNSVTANVKT